MPTVTATVPTETSGQFDEAFACGMGSIHMECTCGRDHFEDDERAGDWEDGELERLRKEANKPNSKTIAHQGSVSAIHIAGGARVRDCPCGWLHAFENLLWEQREEILTYLELRWRTDEAIVNRCGEYVKAAKAAKDLAGKHNRGTP